MTIDKVTAYSNRKLDPDTLTYLAHILEHQDKRWQAKDILEDVLKADRPPFAMRPEAKKLYEKVKDAKKPESTPPARTP